MSEFTKEQIYIVTGASSGLGEATAIMLNKQGATVVAIARRESNLKEMQKKCKYPENVFIEVKDLTEDIEGLPKYVKSLKEKYGKFSGMAYCAGIGELQPIQVLNLNDMIKTFKINYFAPVFMLKSIADRRNNIGKGTSFVFISSAGAIGCDPGMSSYAGSKAALASSVKSISRELSRQGIRVNCVLPTLINTAMADDIARAFSEGSYPLGIGEPDDVANMIIYLLSDKAKWITSQNYIIDCGAMT